MLFIRLLPTPFSRVSSFPISRACRTRKTKEKKEEEIFSAFKVSYGCISAAIWVFLFFPRHCFSPARQCKERAMGLGGKRGEKRPFLLVFFWVSRYGEKTDVRKIFRAFEGLSPSFLSHILPTGVEPFFLKKKSGKFINWETECMTLAPLSAGACFLGKGNDSSSGKYLFLHIFLSPPSFPRAVRP